MRHDFLDRYSRLTSPVHRLPGGVKCAAALLIILTALALPLRLWWGFLLLAGVLAVVVLVSGVPPSFVLRRLLFLEPFVLGVSLLSLFRPDGASVFVSLLVKSTISLLTMIILSNTTPFSGILDVLRRLRVPPILLTVLALMYRYLFVLLDEADRMGRARASRTYTPGRTRWWRNGATVISQLFIRSSERADRIYAAMLARGWK
jgi:cobalt/nickel transport system permease protein